IRCSPDNAEKSTLSTCLWWETEHSQRPPRICNNDAGSRMLLLVAALRRFGRLVPDLGIQFVVVVVTVVIPKPCHRKCQPVFVASFRSHVQKIICPQQYIQTARIR